jgi:hypothetical protein
MCSEQLDLDAIALGIPLFEWRVSHSTTYADSAAAVQGA